MENKRGQNLTLGTIILIVLGVAVLVLLIFGFTQGWTNLWGKVTSFFGGGNNVDTVIQACELACTTESEYDFCTLKRTVRIDANTKAEGTCYQLFKNAVENSAKVSVKACPALEGVGDCKNENTNSEKTPS